MGKGKRVRVPKTPRSPKPITFRHVFRDPLTGWDLVKVVTKSQRRGR